MFEGQPRCIVGDVQIANGTQSRLWGLPVIVDMKEKEVVSKGTGGCPALSFATVVKKNSKWHLKHDNFISFITLTTPMFEKQLKPSLMSAGLKPCLSLYVIKIHKA